MGAATPTEPASVAVQCSRPNSHSTSGAVEFPDEDDYSTPEEYFSSDEDCESSSDIPLSDDNNDTASKTGPSMNLPVFTPPLMLEQKGSKKESKKDEGLKSCLMELFKGLRPGSDLTKFHLPPQFNLPKSQLQVYGESVYCCAEDLLAKCVDAATPLERFLAVVRWHISTTRPGPVKAPYNPILGETHHVSVGHLNVLCEQVSHHPPVSAMYATHEINNLQLLWWHHPVPRFYVSSVEVAIRGQRLLSLTGHKEIYESTSPNLSIRFFPTVGTEWVGTTRVCCMESGLEASVSFKSKSFFRLYGASNKISGKIWKIDSPKEILYELSGGWDQVVTLKDVRTAKCSILYDAQVCLANLHTPETEDLKGISPMESVCVWSTLSENIVRKQWEKASVAKTTLEGHERKLRDVADNSWSPKYFKQTNDGNWVWRNQGKPVPHAPIIVS